MMEREIERKVNAYAEEHGILQMKFSSPMNRGVPDRLYLYGGHVLFVEFKQYGQKPTALQNLKIQQLREAGHEVQVIDTIVNGENMVDEWIAHIKGDL